MAKKTGKIKSPYAEAVISLLESRFAALIYGACNPPREMEPIKIPLKVIKDLFDEAHAGTLSDLQAIVDVDSAEATVAKGGVTEYGKKTSKVHKENPFKRRG